MKDLSKSVSFIPVDYQESSSHKKEVPSFAVAKGKYDADYVINLCKQIICKCENEKFRATELRFSLQHSLRVLVANIEAERLIDPKKPKAFRCDDCGEMYFTLPQNITVSCPHCNNRKQIS